MKFPAIPKDAAQDFEGNVIVVGAGASGLFAANALKFMGVDDFLVLEASDQIGGRLKCAESFHDQVPLDTGAEWIHAANGRKIARDMLVFPPQEGELEESDFMKYQPEWRFRNGNNNQILQFLYQETKWKGSTWWHYLHDHVYSHVQDKVQLSSPVKEIIYTDDSTNGKVKLVMANGDEYLASKVICTIPLAVLKKEEIISFDPPLPQKKREAIDAIDMPPGFRLLIEMSEKFYPDLTSKNTLFQQLTDLDNLTFMYDPLLGKDVSSTQNVLAYVAIGHKNAGTLGGMSEDDLVKGALADIDEFFDGQGTKNYVKHLLQNWTKEPYVLGSYTMSCPKHYRKELAKTVSDKLLFAGEHTCLNYHSLVPGAALEGRRAAVEAVSGRIL